MVNMFLIVLLVLRFLPSSSCRAVISLNKRFVIREYHGIEKKLWIPAPIIVPLKGKLS